VKEAESRRSAVVRAIASMQRSDRAEIRSVTRSPRRSGPAVKPSPSVVNRNRGTRYHCHWYPRPAVPADRSHTAIPARRRNLPQSMSALRRTAAALRNPFIEIAILSTDNTTYPHRVNAEIGKGHRTSRSPEETRGPRG
jgi:hypothetical protein